MQVGLRPSHTVLDGHPDSLPPKGGGSPNFRPISVVAKCWMDQDATWWGGAPQPKRQCVRWGPSSPPQKGAEPPPFSAHVYCGQTAGWMKMPLSTEVDLSPGHTVLDGDPALPAKEEQQPPAPLFLAHVYCGHGRPSQQLLSSCYISLPRP